MTNAEKRILDRYARECQNEALNADNNYSRIRSSAKRAAMQELTARLYREASRVKKASRRLDPNVFPPEPAHPNEPCPGVLTRENDPTAA